jgi:hypothetical protein
MISNRADVLLVYNRLIEEYYSMKRLCQRVDLASECGSERDKAVGSLPGGWEVSEVTVQIRLLGGGR